MWRNKIDTAIQLNRFVNAINYQFDEIRKTFTTLLRATLLMRIKHSVGFFSFAFTNKTLNMMRPPLLCYAYTTTLQKDDCSMLVYYLSLLATACLSLWLRCFAKHSPNDTVAHTICVFVAHV